MHEDLPGLPTGLTSRPLAMSDAPAVFALMAAQELHDTGEVAIEEADIVGDWQRPSFDVAAQTVGVLDAGVLVAYAEHRRADRGDAAVHPGHRGRGVGTALAGWMQGRARAAGATEVGMAVPQGSDGDRLLAALGYHVRWESWVLQLPAGADIPARELPAGHVVRAARPDDYEACWTVLEDAFLEWSVRAREPFDDFLARTARRPGFEPWNLRLVTDARTDTTPTPTPTPTPWSASPSSTPPAPTRTSTVSRPAGTGAATASHRRCSSTRSRQRGRAARPPSPWPPTRAPARSGSTRRSACASSRPG